MLPPDRRSYCLLACLPAGIGQVNDTDLHEALSRRYQDLEQEDHVLQTEMNTGCPTRDRQDCVRDFCSVWKDPELHAFAAQGFKRRGISNALDGSDDHELSGEAAKVWERVEMPALRELLVSDVRQGHAQGEIPWTYKNVYNLIEDFPTRGQMDVLYDGQEPQGPDEPCEDAWSDNEEPDKDDAPNLADLQSCLDSPPLPLAPVCSEAAAAKVAEHVRTSTIIDDMLRCTLTLKNNVVLGLLERARVCARRRAKHCQMQDFL